MQIDSVCLSMEAAIVFLRKNREPDQPVVRLAVFSQRRETGTALCLVRLGVRQLVQQLPVRCRHRHN